MSAPSTDQLVGSWQLVSWEVTRDAVTEAPFGERPEGLLIYAADGWMQAMVSTGDRPRPSHPSPRRVPDVELAAAARGFFAYGGRWEVQGDVVVHRVSLAANPALVGTDQRRHAHLDADQLTLSADEPVAGRLRRHRLVWRRARGTTLKENER